MGEEVIGVVDRFEEGQAVVLLETNGETIDEVVVPRTDLPDEGDMVDAVFRIRRQGDQFEDIEFDAEETKRRKESVKDQFDRLSERPE